MKRFLLKAFAMLLIGLALGAGWFGYRAYRAQPNLTYARILGTPGPHSMERRLPELAMELRFDRAGRRLLARQDNGQILSWDLKQGRSRELARTEGLFAYCAAEDLLLTDDAAGDVFVLDLASGERRLVTSGPYDHAAWSADCLRFALAGAASEAVELWLGRHYTRLARVETEMAARNGLALSADGRFLAVAEGTYDDGIGHETRLEIFEETGGKELTRRALIDRPKAILGIWKMRFTPDGGRLITGSQVDARSGLRSFSSADGARTWGWDGFASYWVRALAVSPDGVFLASGDEKGLLRLWDAARGKKLFEGRSGLVIQDLAYSADGRRLALSLWDGTIAVIETKSLILSN